MLLAITTGLLVFFFLHKDYQKDPSYLSGDEPHYIMMTDSLVKDSDFNLKNDYELERSLEYYPVPDLFPHLSPVIDQNSEHWYSIHTIGLPVVLYGPYRLFGLIGARVWIILLQTSAVVIFYLILKRYLPNKRQHVVGTGLLIVCPLFWQNLGGIYPDVLIMNTWGILILLFGRRDNLSNLAIMGLVVLATLLHSKGLVLTAPLALFHNLWLIRVQTIKGWLKQCWINIGAAVIGILFYVYFLQRNYGVWNPSQLYGSAEGSQLFSTNPLLNIIALLTDRSKGLFVHFPLLLVVLPYIYMAVLDLIAVAKKIIRKHPKLRIEHYLLGGLAVGVFSSLVTVLSFNDWSGSTAPNGRSMLPFIVVIIFLVARYAKFHSRFESLAIGLLAILSVWLSYLSISDFKYYMSTGVNSFWVDRFEALRQLPIFSLVIQAHERGYIIRGAKILLVLLIVNVGLHILYQYQLSFKKRV